MGVDSTNDLNWLAFAYVAGEMAADEAEAFELRLAEDQQAREAVARAVELTQVVVAAEAHGVQPVAVAQRPFTQGQAASWSTRLAWMAIGGVAALLIALFAGSLNRGPQPVVKHDGARPAASQAKARELALAWSSTRAALADNDVELWYAAHLAASENADAIADDADDAEGIADAPSWMTAGVFGLAGKTPQEALQPDDSPEPFSCERGDN